MLNEYELYQGKPAADSSVWDDIQNFVTPRQMDILCALKDERLSQGELAQRVHMKPTALANHLIKIDTFYPKLLERAYEGKYCYYTLSEWARRFLEEKPEAGAARVRESTALLDRQDELLITAAESSVAELKRQFGDKWEKVFNHVVVYYVLGCTVAPDGNAKGLVKQYLKSFGLLMLHQNERLVNKMLALLEDGATRGWVTDFMDDFFMPFSVVLKKVQEKEQLFAVREVLEFLFAGGDPKAVGAHLDALHWDDGTLQELQGVSGRIKERVSGYGRQEIYEYFTVLLPDQEAWALMVSQWI